jgi:membrane-associated phospholipid phosphatase
MAIRSRTALIGAGICAALLALVWFCAFHVRFFEHADQSIFLQFSDLYTHNRISTVAGHLVRQFNPDRYVYLVLVPILVALFRGRPRIAFAVGAVILGANVSTELLKHLVAAPRASWLLPGGYTPIPPVSWPSGHSTAAMSLVLACVLAVPARLRPAVAALGGVLAIAVGYSLLVTAKHYPSDVLGGFLVATTWTLMTVAALRAADRRRESVRAPAQRISLRASLGPIGGVLAAAIVLTVIVLISRGHRAVSYAHAHGAFVIGACAIAALGIALSTGVALTVRGGGLGRPGR